MVTEVIAALVIDSDGWYADGTLGGGGHTRSILEAVGPAGHVFGVDRDPSALTEATRNLADKMTQIELALGNFRDLPELLPPELHGHLSGILLDLGLRSTALDEPDRGFSFQADGPLDMRFNPLRGESAADLLRRIKEADLANLLAEGQSRSDPRKMARDIVRWRREKPLRTTGDLVACLKSSLGRWANPKLLSAVFSAIRMRVNKELDDLEQSMDRLPGLLRLGGILCVLSYQSLEDRRVKSLRRTPLRDPVSGESFLMEPLTKKPIFPTPEEARINRRARSARLRAFRRVRSTKAT